MFVLRIFKIILIVFFGSMVSFSQIEKQAKLKIQIERTINDAANLKLAENKALVYAELGNIYWKYDENRSRQLYRRSVDNLIVAQREAEVDKKNYVRRNDLLIFGTTRRKILEGIVYHDAKLAFDLFLKSRSTTVKEAFAGISNEPAFNSYNGVSSDKLIVEQEKLLEQNLAELVADQNSARTVEILRGLLRKNSSYKPVELLRKVYQKDKTVAESLTAEILQKIIASDFSKSPSDFQAAAQFLVSATTENNTENLIKLNAETLHNLAEKVAVFLIGEADRNAEYQITYLTPTLIKILPERAAELKEKTVAPRRSSFVVFPQNKQATELLQNDTPPEKLLAEADKFPPAFREQIYVAAINKIALAGDVNRAKEILIKNFPVQRRDELFAALNWQLAYRAIEKGDFEQAIILTELLPENSRFEVLINLAESVFLKTGDSRKAVSILEKAHALIPVTPSNLQEIYKTGQLAAVYALIDPETGFNLLERIITKIAEVSEANVIVENFRGNSNISKNEFIINSGFLFSGFSEVEVSLDKLTKIDCNKTLEIINKIQRRDVRIALQLKILKNASGY